MNGADRLDVPPPVPLADPESAGYWDALRDGVLAICRCGECGRWMHPPIERCRRCGGPTSFEPVAGTGTVFSFIVVRHAAVPGLPLPYVTALVELDEQPGLRMTGIVEADPADVRVGARVRVRITDPDASGYRSPRFALRADCAR